MRMTFVILTASCLSTPTLAQDDEGLSLMERGAQLFLEGILKEMEPALEGLEGVGPALRDFALEMGPALGDFVGQVEDWSVYHPPEILPNGDIILRRKTPAEIGPDITGPQIDL